MLALTKKVVWATLFIVFLNQLALNVKKFSLGYKGMAISQEITNKHPPLSFLLCGFVDTQDAIESGGIIDWATDHVLLDDDKW